MSSDMSSHASPKSVSSAPGRRKRRAPVQQYDSSSDEETSDGADDNEDEIGGSEDEDLREAEQQPSSTQMNPQHPRSTSSRRRLPHRLLNTSRRSRSVRDSSRAAARNVRPSDKTDNLKKNSVGGRARSPSYFPPIPYPNESDVSQYPAPPSNRLPQEVLRQSKPDLVGRATCRPPRPRTHTVPPHLGRTNTGSTSTSTSTSTITSAGSSPSSALSMGPWQAVTLPLKRTKTVREAVKNPVQAVVPRAPQTIAAARLQKSGFDESGVEQTGSALAAVPRKLVAGGKKAALAVELKLNLEIELELKAYIHGDVMLELFN